jgi:hypothetical protein
MRILDVKEMESSSKIALKRICCDGCPSKMLVTSFQWYENFVVSLILKAPGIQI